MESISSREWAPNPKPDVVPIPLLDILLMAMTSLENLVIP
jgi:hypothetical protein